MKLLKNFYAKLKRFFGFYEFDPCKDDSFEESESTNRIESKGDIRLTNAISCFFTSYTKKHRPLHPIYRLKIALIGKFLSEMLFVDCVNNPYLLVYVEKRNPRVVVLRGGDAYFISPASRQNYYAFGLYKLTKLPKQKDSFCIYVENKEWFESINDPFQRYKMGCVLYKQMKGEVHIFL